MKTAEPPAPPEDMPGLEMAYGFVHPSYQWALSRFEAGDTRLQTMQAVVASVSLGVTTLARLLGETLSFTDGWFWFAAGLFTVAMAVGVAGRLTGTVKVAHPRVLLDRRWLELPAAEFRYHALREAADHFDENAAAIRWKWRCAWTMLTLFLAELGLLVVWAL